VPWVWIATVALGVLSFIGGLIIGPVRSESPCAILIR
jgi:hypothetical protein